jgi:phosphoribosylpyrophosphate synthetase
MLHSLSIGEKVFFDGLSLTVTDLLDFCAWNNTSYPEVKCTWLDRQGVIQEKIFKEAILAKEVQRTKNNIEVMPLLHSKELDCYGWKRYSSIIANNFGKSAIDTFEREDLQTRFVYDFKKYGSHKTEIIDYLEFLKLFFETTTVVVVPSHLPVLNELQKLVGSQVIERTKESIPRKYNHKVGLAEDYEDSYTIHWHQLKEKKLILIDDVCTSGVTLSHFANVLQQKGYEVIKFSLGVNARFPIEVIYQFFVKK